MKKNHEKNKGLGRRRFLPILGTGLLLSLLPGKVRAAAKDETQEEYKTMLKPDGTAVRVKVSGLKESKVVRKNISNKELLSWLKKDNQDS